MNIAGDSPVSLHHNPGYKFVSLGDNLPNLFTMKSAFTLILCLVSFLTFSQNTDSMGTGDQHVLNTDEISFLNSIFNGESFTMEFEGKKVAFVDDQSKDQIVSKKAFFDKYITPHAIDGTLPKFSVKGLSEEEKKMAGGMDIIFYTHDASIDKKMLKAIGK